MPRWSGLKVPWRLEDAAMERAESAVEAYVFASAQRYCEIAHVLLRGSCSTVFRDRSRAIILRGRCSTVLRDRSRAIAW